jgi:disulfide oxidoreductase YuzD
MIEHRTIAYLGEDVMKNRFDRGFYQEDLWDYVADKPTKKYNMKDVKHWVYSPCWSYNLDGTECFYSIYQVLMQKNRFKKDMKRIRNADISYPIIVIEDEFDKYGSILDGNHRFGKLIMENKRKVDFKYISTKELKKLLVKI